MSEATVDVNSKTSLLKRLWRVTAADFTKGAKAYTSLLNWGFMALAVWQVIGPIYASSGAKDANAQVANMSGQIDDLKLANDKLTADFRSVNTAYEATKADNAELAKQLEIARTDTKPAAAVKASFAPEPPVKTVKVKKTPLPPKADPTLYEQFVAWYETNVGTPGAN